MSKGKPCFENIDDSNLQGEMVCITLCKKPRICYSFPAKIIRDLQKISQGKTLRLAAVRQMNLTEERREELRERMKVLGAKNRAKKAEEVEEVGEKEEKEEEEEEEVKNENRPRGRPKRIVISEMAD
jgi:hypothetical protein